MAESNVIVVGAGMGGLTAAADLVRRGRRVVVLEAAPRAGGYQCRRRIDGFQFEPHFHFLQESGPGQPIRELLAVLGVEPEWMLVDPIAELFFPDRRVTIPNDRAAFIAQLQEDFPAEARGIAALFEETLAIHRAWARLPRLEPALARHLGDSTEQLLRRHLTDPQLIAIVGAWAAYFGYGAHEISGVAIAEFTEACFDGGINHPVGGITAIVDALVGVIEAGGGEVRLGAPVAAILAPDDAVSGVRLASGETLAAPVVVSALSAPATAGALTGEGPRARKVRARLVGPPTFRSPFSVLVGVNGGGVDGAAVRIAFPGYDFRKQDAAQMAGDVAEAPLSIGIPTRLNPELAPAGGDIALLYTFMGADRIEPLVRDPALAQAHAERLVDAAEAAIPGLRTAAVSVTPSTVGVAEVYADSGRGALGWSPSADALVRPPALAAALRTGWGGGIAAGAARLAGSRLGDLAAKVGPPGPDTPVRGLFLAGQWTRTGPGMNNVMRSGALAAEAAARP